VAITYVMLGVSILAPWAVFSTANDFYVDFKLKWIAEDLKTDVGLLKRLEEYQDFFINYLGIVFQVPDTLATVVNLLFISESNCRPRLLILCVVMMWINAVILVLAMVDTRTWPEWHIVITLIIVAGLGFTAGLFASVVWCSTADFPGMEMYINLGTSFSGIAVALFSIIAKLTATRGDSDDGLTPVEYIHKALFYFMSSLVICCASSLLFGAMRYNKYYRSHYKESLKRAVVKKNCKEETMKLKPVFAKTWRLQITLFYLMVITLACFPSIQAGIEPQKDGIIPEVYYLDIVCFLTFNVAGMIGNFITLKVKYPGPGTIWIPVVLRTLFIPFLMFCNYKPEDRNTPVVFHNDAFHGVASALLGFSNGYLIVILMEQIFQKAVDERVDVGMAMKLGATMVDAGVAVGCLFGLLLAKLAVV